MNKTAAYRNGAFYARNGFGRYASAGVERIKVGLRLFIFRIATYIARVFVKIQTLESCTNTVGDGQIRHCKGSSDKILYRN